MSQQPNDKKHDLLRACRDFIATMAHPDWGLLQEVDNALASPAAPSHVAPTERAAALLAAQKKAQAYDVDEWVDLVGQLEREIERYRSHVEAPAEAARRELQGARHISETASGGEANYPAAPSSIGATTTYVPGLWRCAKCKLDLLTTNLHVYSGTTSPNTDPQQCPNGCGPMWRVSEADYRKELLAQVNKLFDELRESKQLAAEWRETHSRELREARSAIAATGTADDERILVLTSQLHHSLQNTDEAFEQLDRFAEEVLGWCGEAVAHYSKSADNAEAVERWSERARLTRKIIEAPSDATDGRATPKNPSHGTRGGPEGEGP